MSKDGAKVVGAGDALGAAIGRRFARAGFVACLARRSGDKVAPICAAIRADGGLAHGFACDARREEQVEELFREVEDTIGPVEVAVHKDALKRTTEGAVARGAFGAPTFLVGDAMFWGQDRLDFVEEALRQGDSR